MVDVQVRVQDPANVTRSQVVLRQLVLELHLLGHVAGHPEPLHDLGVARARVDEDGLLAAENQEAECRNTRPDPHVAA